MLTGEEAAATHRVGPFDVSGGADELTLRLENRGELSLKGCFLFAFTMCIVLALGFLSVLHPAETNVMANVSVDDPERVFAPTQNHLGFLWLCASLLMLVLVPLYVLRAYKAALTFTFRKSDDAFLRDQRLVTHLGRIEYVSIRETKDPDARYLYLLNIVYGDGQEMLLHNGYEEREVMNLANEISGFLGRPVVWK
jgi:hypothetical protein